MSNIDELAGIILFIIKASFWIIVFFAAIATIGFIVESFYKAISKSPLPDGRTTVGIKVISGSRKFTINKTSDHTTLWAIIIIFFIILLIAYITNLTQPKLESVPTITNQSDVFLQESNNSSEQTPTPTKKQYPNNVRNNFINSCIASGKGYTSETLCSCMLENIETNYSLNEYIDIELEYLKDGKFPDAFQDIIYKNCVKK
jgi:hypothetical protein